MFSPKSFSTRSFSEVSWAGIGTSAPVVPGENQFWADGFWAAGFWSDGFWGEEFIVVDEVRFITRLRSRLTTTVVLLSRL